MPFSARGEGALRLGSTAPALLGLSPTVLMPANQLAQLLYY